MRQSYAGGASDRLRGRPIEERLADGTIHCWHYLGGFFSGSIMPTAGDQFVVDAGGPDLQIRAKRDVRDAGASLADIPGRTSIAVQYLRADGTLAGEEAQVVPLGGKRSW